MIGIHITQVSILIIEFGIESFPPLMKHVCYFSEIACEKLGVEE